VTAVTSVKAIVQRSALARRAARRYRLRASRPDWSAALAGSQLPDAADGGRVLVATSLGAHLPSTTVESVLAAALRLRGAEPHVLLCDGALPSCMECTLDRIGSAAELADIGPRRALCGGCFAAGASAFDALGIPVHRYSELLTDDERASAAALAREVSIDAIESLVVDGLALGEHALAGALRFFARATLAGEARSDDVLRRYLEAAILTADATGRLLDTHAFDVAVFHHGIYVPQGIVGAVCRQRGVRVVNWNPAYRDRTFVFSHHDTYHHTLLDEPTSEWTEMDWGPDREAELLAYLESRWSGSNDWISWHQGPTRERADIEAEVGIDFSQPTIGMLTNVMWDAQLHYPANAFATMRDWVIDTVGYFAARPDLQLLIRVHPAELTGFVVSRQPIVDEIRAVFPELPPNVFVIGPESGASTYAAMLACDSVLIYGTKTGVELTALGIPVIVAGEAWIRGKGVTVDVSSRAHYRETLDQLPFGRRLDDTTIERARRYAYHFFFRRMIPVGFTGPGAGKLPYTLGVESFAQLEPGADAGLDVICDGILSATPFIHRAEARAAAAVMQ
jgi:hypothetical protein